MDPSAVRSICEVAGTDVEKVVNEMKVAEKLLLDNEQLEVMQPDQSLLKAYTKLRIWHEAFPTLSQTMAAALTFGSSNAV